MELISQCENWFREKKYSLIIKALENISKNYRNPALDLMLAKAYINIAHGWEDRNLYRKALILLRPLEGQSSHEFEWNYWTGKAFLGLEQFSRAIKYLRKAQEIKPNSAKVQLAIKECKSLLIKPRFSETFLTRTANAWRAFNDIEPELLEMIQKFPLASKKIGEVSDKADKAFEIAMSTPGLVLAQGNAKYGLIFSPKGNWANFFEQCIVVSQSPQYVRQNWEIFIGALPTNYMNLVLFGIEFCSKDALVWLDNINGNYKLSVYSSKLATLPKNLKDIYPQLATDYIDNAIGELPRMKFFGKPEVLELPKVKPPIPMHELCATLKKEGFDLSLDPMLYLVDFEPYETSATKGVVPESEYGKARSDILKGYTTFKDLILEYSKKKNDIADRLISDGAIPGFIFFSPPVKDGPDNEENMDFSKKLQRELVDKTKPQAITLTGVASGFAWWYVDFIAWDIANVLEVAKEFFRQNPPLFCGFQVFHTESEPDLWQWLWK
ncbi:MAG: hypothetical protein LUC43_08945 [Burkholderiales bacterium]|nr:hypothetical protein [Burkholderiales bacterium]